MQPQRLDFGSAKIPGREEYVKRLAYELHKPIKRKFDRRAVYSNGVDHLWGADLVDMPAALTKKNDGYRYILTVIDHTSKYAWAQPLKTKTGREVANAFAEIFNEGRHPQLLWVDQGKEFYNKEVNNLLQAYGVTMYSTHSELKVSIAERFNRTLKTHMFRLFTEQGKEEWVAMLPQLLHDYNNTTSSVTKMTPTQASTTEIENKPEGKLAKPVFKIGDIVRISKYKGIFEKGYLANWSTEQFKVTGYLQRPGDPCVYYLRDLKGEEIKGAFYAQELQLVKYPYPIQFVQNVLQRREGKAKVRWLGFDERFDSWIPESQIQHAREL
jgi:hypothetical protein